MPVDVTESVVSPQQQQQYQEEGYMILERVIPDDMLTMLREECSYFVGYMDGMFDADPSKHGGITHKGIRYFIGNKYNLSHRMWRFIYSDLMAQITQAALGPDVYLFNEQWVVKGPDKGMKFAWHQDSGYVKHGDKSTTHKPYLSCWCALDDMSEENGTVYVLPHSRGGTSHTIFDHDREQVSNDLVGYTGDDPGVPVVCPAGSIVAFTSYNFHRSGANTTPRMRRVYLGQYSAEPIVGPGGKHWQMAVPFVRNGKVVYDHANDTPETAFANRRS
jgi:ectoine hydroxylase-related dioxygenase (phytanoyl-CoA dioxygenase family)